MSSEEVYLEPALVWRGDALAQRLEHLLEESWAEFEAEQGLAGAARLEHHYTGHGSHQHQRKDVTTERHSPLGW